MQALSDFFQTSFPWCERMSVLVGGTLGAVVSFLFGSDASEALYWLLVFIVADWVTAVWLACRTHTLSSSKGFVGLLRKGLILGIVALCHGVDVACGLEAISVQTICIGAYAINECVSIVENLILLGYKSCIPPVVLSALALVKDEQEKRAHALESQHDA